VAAPAPFTVPRPPVIDSDAPDPSVVRAADGFYYAFTTNTASFGPGGSNVPVFRSSDLASWTFLGDALPSLGPWAALGYTWAPAVAWINGQWLLYYTARDQAFGAQCIGIAVASNPAGPYTDNSAGPFVCQLDHGGSIDPSPYEDTLGQWWLLWKSDDNAIGRTPGIWSQPLTPDGLAFAGPINLLLVADQLWENRIVEAPSMIATAGRLWLFYSAGPFDSGSYAVGYAFCDAASGPCAKQTTTGPWLGFANTGLPGPGGESFVTVAAGQVDMAFHGWRGAIGYVEGGYRALYIEPVDFEGPVPVIRTDWARDGPSWHAPIRVRNDGVLASGPAATAVRGANRVDSFVVGTDSAVYWTSYQGTSFSSWAWLGAPPGGVVGEPAAASWAPGRLDVFARGTNNKLWQQFSTNGGSSWSGWFMPFPDGTLASSPATATWAPNRLDVFATGTDGQIYQRFWDTTSWSTAWLARGRPSTGIVQGTPAAASWAPGRLDVFTRGTDNKLWQTFWDGHAWSTWIQPPGTSSGTLTTAPSATSWGLGQLAVFARGTDGGVFTTSFDGIAWGAWSRLGAATDVIVGPPTATSRGQGALDVFARGTDNKLYQFFFSP
jgi:GH43 family beta-xylosidase